MSPETIVAILGIVLAFFAVVILFVKKFPKRLKQTNYTRKWRDIQKLCADKSNWPQAIMLGDLLLDDVMKKKQKTGKTMGERMVNCQKIFSNNDMTWKAHKLASHVRHSADKEAVSLKESDVKDALIGFRTALRDLGAL